MPVGFHFQSDTLSKHPAGQAAARILSAALNAVEPEAAIQKFVERRGRLLSVDGQVYNLGAVGRISLLALGKAAEAMALPLLEMLADVPLQGLLIPKQTPRQPFPRCFVQPGGHPIPTAQSLQAGQKALELVQNLTENDLLICLISGGGSALMSAPQLGVSLTDLQALTSALLACGARIDEINTLRRRLDRLKGGGLAHLASPARVISLILSDVVGNPLEAIASGPTAPDPATRADALKVIEKYHLETQIAPAILIALNADVETAKAGDPIFARVQNVIVGSNQLAAQAALTQAEAEGFQPFYLGSDWQGEARETAKTFCQTLKKPTFAQRFCAIAGGETTVTLHGHGRGGRNQELALAAVPELADLPNVMLISLATDGEDGPTDAAGAVVTGNTLERGSALGLKPETFLANNDAYSYFDALGDLLKPGPSGTNVNDLVFMFRF